MFSGFYPPNKATLNESPRRAYRPPARLGRLHRSARGAVRANAGAAAARAKACRKRAEISIVSPELASVPGTCSEIRNARPWESRLWAHELKMPIAADWAHYSVEASATMAKFIWYRFFRWIKVHFNAIFINTVFI